MRLVPRAAGRSCRLFLSLVVVMGVIGVGLVGCKAAPETILLSHGSVATASGLYAYDVAATEVMNTIPGFNVSIHTDPGTVSRIQRMESGELDLGVIGYETGWDFLNGKGPFKGEPHPDLRGLWIHRPSPHAFVVRADSGITKIEELEGRDFSAGGAGTGSEVMMLAVLEAAGIKINHIKMAQADFVKATKDRRIVGFAKAGAPLNPDSLIQEMMATTEIRILSWPRELAERVQRESLPGYSIFEIPPGVYDADWNKEPILTWIITVGNATMKNSLSVDMAYKIVKAIREDNLPTGGQIQASAYPGVKGIDFAKQTVQLSRIPLHEGAIKYYKEIGLDIPDYLIPPEAR